MGRSLKDEWTLFPTGNEKMLAEQYNDEKIVMECLIVETGSVLGNVVTIIGAAKNALALTGINFLSSKVTDLCEKWYKRHDLVLKKLQMNRDKENKEAINLVLD